MADKAAELEAERALEQPFDTSDAEQVSERRKAVGRRGKRKDSALLNLMSKEDGRIWMFDLLEACHVHGNVIGEDAYRTYALIGERNIGMLVVSQLEAVCPELLVKMMSENRTRK